jgi:uncharacterized membrane protein HdeD (DUF308 family)
MPRYLFDPEIGLFARRWWAVLLRGILAVMVGVLTFAWPAVTLYVLVLLFGCYALVDGVFSLVTAAGGRNRQDRWILALEGVIGLWAGVVALRAPHVIATVLIFFVSFWAMTMGFLKIAAAYRLRREISGEFWLAASGVLSVVFALLVLARPAIGAISLVLIFAGYITLMGIIMIMLGLELRGVQTSGSHDITTHPMAHRPV